MLAAPPLQQPLHAAPYRLDACNIMSDNIRVTLSEKAKITLSLPVWRTSQN